MKQEKYTPSDYFWIVIIALVLAGIWGIIIYGLWMLV